MSGSKYKKFVPKLSAHNTRLLRKIFLDNKHDQTELVQSLADQITIFSKKLSINDPVTSFMKMNRENIVFQTCF